MLYVFSYKLVDKSDFDSFYLKIRSKLPQTLIAKIDGYSHPLVQQRSLMGDLMVRSFYEKSLSKDSFQLEFEYNEHEKPLLKNFPNSHFNISHSGDYVLVAFSDKPVGIDIEKNKGNRLKVAQRFFTQEEQNDLFSLPTIEKQIDYFYQLWTLKESYMKAIGKGISMSLSSFSFQKEEDFGLLYSSDDIDFHFSTYEDYPEYALSLCSKYSKKPNIEILKLSNIISDIKAL